MKSELNILITGATGLIGRPLCQALQERGHTVVTVSRGDHADYKWDVSSKKMNLGAFNSIDVVVHLAGESIAQRWTKRAKQRILSSRVNSTQLLVDSILQQEKRPSFISASGISYYGLERSSLLDESGSTGGGFLAEVTRQWEGAAQPLVDAGVRTAFLRTGIVLSKEGGALAKMLPPFKLGLGGRIGDGCQKMSWVSLPDLVAMYVFAVENESVSGPINAVAPHPSSNATFTKALGKVLSRPAFLPLPASIVRILFGQMGKETVLSNLGVVPSKLQDLEFVWESPDLEQTLREQLK